MQPHTYQHFTQSLPSLLLGLLVIKIFQRIRKKSFKSHHLTFENRKRKYHNRKNYVIVSQQRNQQRRYKKKVSSSITYLEIQWMMMMMTKEQVYLGPKRRKSESRRATRKKINKHDFLCHKKCFSDLLLFSLVMLCWLSSN